MRYGTMKTEKLIWKVVALCGVILCVSGKVYAEVADSLVTGKTGTTSMPVSGNKVNSCCLLSSVDSLSFTRRFIHRIGVEFRPEHIFQTNSFLRGENYTMKSIRSGASFHLKYSFQFQPNTAIGNVYRGAYQGIGLAYNNFGEPDQLGNPVSLYLFQGARIAELNRHVSLNYEWNFGMSFGWKPYDGLCNSYNKVIGSKANAYINTNFYLNWILSSRFDLTTGISVAHYSNGNTKFPNAGLNTIALKVGLVCNINRQDEIVSRTYCHPVIPSFPRHVSYDLVLFGSWRRKGVSYGDTQIAVPKAFTVLGFNFAPMYNLGYKFRAGVSLDGVYDGSANVYAEDCIAPAGGSCEEEFITPSLNKQLALGLSGRVEYVMPFFTVGIGIGANVLHGGGDLKGCYQILALKIDVTRNSFLHVGYNLQDFHDPNYLMLGLGYRFNNRRPKIHR